MRRMSVVGTVLHLITSMLAVISLMFLLSPIWIGLTKSVIKKTLQYTDLKYIAICEIYPPFLLKNRLNLVVQ